MSSRPERPGRESFRHFRPIQTRWMDNDVYGHVNNVVYYAYFDTAVNAFLVEQGLLDPARSETIGLVVETACTYFESVAFPDALECGIAAARIGQSSVRYATAIFREGGALAVAQGHFTHVYVARATGRPVPLSEAMRAALAGIAA